jgi:hypothetical protein
MLLAIAGLILGILGVIYAFTAHPLVVERLKQSPSRGLARLTNILYLTNSQVITPYEISLYDVIYNPVTKNQIYRKLPQEKK